MSRAQRLLDLIQELRGHRRAVGGAALAESLGISLRTLYRDIETLKAQGADWCAAEETPIKPLLDRLKFTSAKSNWGYQLRFGLFEICEDDMALIADAMGARLRRP